MRTPFIFLLLSVCEPALTQVDPFEGSITYNHRTFTKEGTETLSAIETEEVYFNSRFMMRRVLSGQTLTLTGNRDILLDSDSFKRFQIDHDKHTFSELDAAQPDDFKQFADMQLHEEDTILGHTCEVYKFRYLLKSEVVTMYGVEMKIDTLNCEYFISTELKLSKPEVFARLQGYRNTKLLDGRFEGIPLKIITTNSNGFRLVIEAVKIEERKIDDFVRIPENYVEAELIR